VSLSAWWVWSHRDSGSVRSDPVSFVAVHMYLLWVGALVVAVVRGAWNRRTTPEASATVESKTDEPPLASKRS
jgi:hypothetical protein